MIKMNTNRVISGIEFTHWAATIVASPVIANDSHRVVLKLQAVRLVDGSYEAAPSGDVSVIIKDTSEITDLDQGTALMGISQSLTNFVNAKGL